MDPLFWIVAILVVILVGCALGLNSEVVRGGVIAVLLLGAFVLPFAAEHALAFAQGREIVPMLRQQDCREVWSHALTAEHERLSKELRFTFLFSSALAIVAAVSRRKR